jgi:hypothetical protein
MFEDFYFLDEDHVKITAATVGISKKRWKLATEEDVNTGSYKEVMQRNRFDHLPIVSNEKRITEYFKTIKPNDFSRIEKHEIKFNDIIPLDTNIREVIEKFASSGRSFYFLSYHKNISGLITLGNLNCKQVQIYLFSLLCDLERALSDFLNSELTNQEIQSWIESKINPDDPSNKFALIISHFNELVNTDLENQLTEHLFLVDFFEIIKKFNLNIKLNYSKTKFDELSSINELRKKIAHPTRSLLDNDNNIFKLKERLDKIDDLSFRLNKYKERINAQQLENV